MQLRSTAGQKTFQRGKKKQLPENAESAELQYFKERQDFSSFVWEKKKTNYFDGNIKLHFLVNPKENTAPKHDRFL